MARASGVAPGPGRANGIWAAHLFVAVCLSAVGVAPAQADWVVGGYLGAGHTMSGGLSIAQPAADTNVTFASIDYHGESFTLPVYYGYRITYFLPRASSLGVELEFIHLKVYARTEGITRATGRSLGIPVDQDVPVRDILESFSISHGLNLALVNLVARHALTGRAGSEGRLAVVGRMGLGPTIPHAESRIGGVAREGYEIGALGLHLAGGLEARLARGLAAMAEYKLTHTDQSVAVSQGQAQGRFTSHHGIFGFGWHF